MRFVIHESAEGAWFVLEDQAHQVILVSRLFRNANWCRAGIQAIVDLMSETNMRKKTVSNDPMFQDRFSECVYIDADGLVRFALITGLGNVLANSRAYQTLNAYNNEITWVCRKIRGAHLVKGEGIPHIQPTGRNFSDLRMERAADFAFSNARV
ncbi:MAG: hypothetical protein Q4E13_09325 [Clostridia bacterium]|nr:hypothetical protein [Clostridia bacterium]